MFSGLLWTKDIKIGSKNVCYHLKKKQSYVDDSWFSNCIYILKETLFRVYVTACDLWIKEDVFVNLSFLVQYSLNVDGRKVHQLL